MNVVISVVSDLVTDQRVHRTSMTLHNKGLKVTLIGRRKKDSLGVIRPYKTVRFNIWWEKGPLFYIAYNIRLFFYLLFHKANVLVANDLDTLLPNYLVSGIKGSELYYDSHEYFTEVPELVNRPRIQGIWKSIERFIFPKLKHVYTVNDSIAELYRKEYNKEVAVVRNVPFSKGTKDGERDTGDRVTFRSSMFGLPAPSDKKILLFQGAGINVHRGGEEAIQAMQYLDNYMLVFIGGGDVIDTLKQMSQELNVADKVRFISKLPFDQLREYSRLADIGLTLDKDTNLNYRYSLPNKLFDYIHAGLPVLATNLVEVSKIVEGYKIGMIVNELEAKALANSINEMFSDQKRFDSWKENLKIAEKELCWEKEEQKLLNVFCDVL